MAYALQQLINGLTLGMIYGLIAVGYTMVYGIIGMINFAHGDVFMIGAFVGIISLTALTGITSVPLGLLAAFVLAAVFCGVYGFAIERVAYRPLRGSFRLAPLISAIGMSILLENYVQVSQGALERAIPNLIPGGFTLMDENGFVVQLSWMQISIVVVTLIVLAVFTYIVTKTPLGRAMRAVEQDAKMAALLGIDTNRTITLTFIIGSCLAAFAGVMFLLYYGVIDFYIGFNAGIKAFTAAVLGGIGSLPGAVLGGLLIGLIEAFWSGYATVAYKDVAVYSILAIVLMFMPSGLLGRHEVEKV
ncbi:ABC transporter permease subunit [Acidocella sp.]|jgi:branched-chain amino acid transport system permease protein|uniref:ABC transporter permease subunit n=1 Tax=Acidocella sp. TaxID=50710 RepID=UPI00261F9C4B|nr:branched-chain amino acid ABC transporter permease LivH [Acidocella sp.]